MHDELIAPAMRQFMRDSLNRALLKRLLAWFAEPLAARYPNLESDYGRPDAWRLGLRFRDDFQHCDAQLECQCSLHTPVYGSAPAADRGPHVKTTDKLFVGHLYLRQPGDRGNGGGLELFSPAPGTRLRFGRDSVVERTKLRLEKTIPFDNNVLVFWLNSPDALQGFAPRTRSMQPMTYMNFYVILPRPLFALPLTTATRLRNLAGRLRYRFSPPRHQIDGFRVGAD